MTERGPHDPIEFEENILGDFVDEPRLITVSLSTEQVAAVVYCLLEQVKQMQTPTQIEWSRLAIALNDLILEVPDEPAESD